MSTRTPVIFLEDILEAITKIERYTKGITWEAFEQDELIIDAVLRNIEVIGEATANIPQSVRVKYDEIPWKRMVGLRNIIIHAYFHVDLMIIWQIIRVNLPEVYPLIEQIHSDLS